MGYSVADADIPVPVSWVELQIFHVLELTKKTAPAELGCEADGIASVQCKDLHGLLPFGGNVRKTALSVWCFDTGCRFASVLE